MNHVTNAGQQYRWLWRIVSCNRADCRWGSEILSAVPAMMVTGIERSIYLGALAAADGTMSANSPNEARI